MQQKRDEEINDIAGSADGLSLDGIYEVSDRIDKE